MRENLLFFIFLIFYILFLLVQFSYFFFYFSKAFSFTCVVGNNNNNLTARLHRSIVKTVWIIFLKYISNEIPAKFLNKIQTVLEFNNFKFSFPYCTLFLFLLFFLKYYTYTVIYYSVSQLCTFFITSAKIHFSLNLRYSESLIILL